MSVLCMLVKIIFLYKLSINLDKVNRMNKINVSLEQNKCVKTCVPLPQ